MNLFNKPAEFQVSYQIFDNALKYDFHNFQGALDMAHGVEKFSYNWKITRLSDGVVLAQSQFQNITVHFENNNDGVEVILVGDSKKLTDERPIQQFSNMTDAKAWAVKIDREIGKVQSKMKGGK